jgi:peptidyl-prolyl cis-trans isomerase B (cyclophilin B)
MPFLKRSIVYVFLFLFSSVAFASQVAILEVEITNPQTPITGEIHIELNQASAPISVANFIEYANAGFYNDTIFHRVIDGFMIQGGGFMPGMRRKTTNAAIKNEAKNGLDNDEYTVGMARTSSPDSATSQFFINVNNNGFLNFKNDQDYGYAVFGKVTRGKDLVDKIRSVKTIKKGYFADVPEHPIIIRRVRVIESESAITP